MTKMFRLPEAPEPARSLRSGLTIAAMLAAGMATAAAQAPPAAYPSVPSEAPPAAGLSVNGMHLSVQLEGGVIFNPATPKDNFGQLFTDRANQPILNQVLVTANKPLDPKTTSFDWGFKLQFLYGADARYTHFLGELDRALPSSDRNQIDLVEANLQAHLPVLTDGGIDLKAGQYASPLGYETIDPSSNPFYSHSYIFNFGLPMKHTGILSTMHVSSLLDVYSGVDTGVNTSVGPYGDNNSAIAVLGGIGLNMMDGAFTVLALTHAGPENAQRAFLPGYNVDRFYRYLNDVVVTYKASDKWTFVTEANLIRDDTLGASASGMPRPANAFGIAQYASYILTDTLTLNSRVEVYRDDNAVFVAAFPANSDYVSAEEGLPATVILAPRPTIYSEITLGVTYKPDLPAPVSGLLVRPEVRYDRSLDASNAFNRGRDDGAFTVAVDVVLTF